jgi:hypothetical protein
MKKEASALWMMRSLDGVEWLNNGILFNFLIHSAMQMQ